MATVRPRKPRSRPSATRRELDDEGFVAQYADYPAVKKHIEHCRSRTIILSALAVRYHWRVTSQLKVPAGIDRAELFASLDTMPDLLINHIDCDVTQFSSDADWLLNRAWLIDPCRDWLTIIRHMDFESWMCLRDVPLSAMWLRIGAEILLRCHEDLVTDRQLEPLPDMSLRRLNRSEPAPELDVSLNALGFRQLYSTQEPTHFASIAKVIGRANQEADDGAATQRRVLLKAWRSAHGRMHADSLDKLLGLQLEKEGRWASSMTPRLHDLSPQELISMYSYGEFIHWDVEKRQQLAAFRNENEISAVRELDYLKAAIAISHIYIGYAVLARAATSGIALEGP